MYLAIRIISIPVIIMILLLCDSVTDLVDKPSEKSYMYNNNICMSYNVLSLIVL